MSRLIICVALILCCSFIMSGCRVCSSPYLYCGPVDDMSGSDCGSCGGSSCDPLYRTGSVLNGYRGGYQDGYYSGMAQAIPYNDENPTPIRKLPPELKTPTPARPAPEKAYQPRGSYSPPANLPSVAPPSLSRELLLQQERGAVDAKIIDIQDNVYAPTGSNSRVNPNVRQVAYEDVQW